MALTQERAALRSKAIEKGSVSYSFNVALEKGNNFEGFCEIGFRLLEVPQ